MPSHMLLALVACTRFRPGARFQPGVDIHLGSDEPPGPQLLLSSSSSSLTSIARGVCHRRRRPSRRWQSAPSSAQGLQSSCAVVACSRSRLSSFPSPLSQSSLADCRLQSLAADGSRLYRSRRSQSLASDSIAVVACSRLQWGQLLLSWSMAVDSIAVVACSPRLRRRRRRHRRLQ